MSSRLFRIVRAIVLALVLVVAALALFVYLASERRLERHYEVLAGDVPAPDDSAAIARGRYLYSTISCALCHGDDGGGKVYVDQMPMGVVVGTNLTSGRGGVAGERTNLDWVRAIRHGVWRDSTSLILMPSEVFVNLTTADLGAVMGYLRSLPPVDRELPASRFGWLGRALLATGRLAILPADKTPPFREPEPVTPGPTAEYGRYLADIAGCHGCHGHGLSGGKVAGPPDLPPASNLTPAGLTNWTQADFARLMREGLRPANASVHPFMPWEVYRNMSDEDLAALWAYLRSVAPKPFGNK
jgi:mono/diheme cytochrome c family protein